MEEERKGDIYKKGVVRERKREGIFNQKLVVEK